MLLERMGKMWSATDVAEYYKYDGFDDLKKAISPSDEEILNELDIAHLRGRGGAAYPLGKKWRRLYHAKGTTKYIVCNTDEGEPGTLKDKVLLSEDLLSVIEGMIIVGYLFSAKVGYIYMWGEYRRIQKTFQEALDNVWQADFLRENTLGIEGLNYDITIISGAGAYICGENSALLNSVEGKTGRSCVKPPYSADIGLYSQSTLVNNVESFASVPVILREGGQAFLEMGTADGGGTKLTCLFGHIKNQGLYEANLGTPLEEIIYGEQYGGGSATGWTLKFIHFGGQSSPIGAAAALRDCLYFYGDLWVHDLSVGSDAIVVMDDSVNVVDYLVRVAVSFAHESCGKCAPCRLGTARILELLGKFNRNETTASDLPRLEKVLIYVTRLSACGLGQSVVNSMKSALALFSEELETTVETEIYATSKGGW